MIEMIERINLLFERQMRAWPLLAAGAQGLAQAKTRPVHIDWFDVHVRHIPHRVVSTTAAVDRESIARRPCFLCVANMPGEQEGIAFNSEFTIYCNPYPIVPRHLTIVHRDHRPQEIAGHLGGLLDIAAALPGYFVIYNGPRCGASAPDHLHFQAGSRELFPIEQDSQDMSGPAMTNYARNVLLFRSIDREHVLNSTGQAIQLLSAVTGNADEPLINIAAFHDSQRGWTVYLFPRGKHRPEVFHTGELTVSPASIDLCGIFVVPVAKDFDRISGPDVAAIFREVTLPDAQLQQVIARLEGKK
jgi:hypothetical protein